MRDDPQKRLTITAISPADLARALSAASGRTITEDLVRTIAEEGGLLAADDTINLLKYTAYLAMSEGQHE